MAQCVDGRDRDLAYAGSSSKQAAIVFGDAAWSVAGTGDFNGDGKADLLWKNDDDGSTAIWLMNGTSTLAAAVVERPRGR